MIKHAPKISVVMAVRNEDRFIGRAIRSVLNQNYPVEGYEVIVVDDASDDRTLYALQLFGDEINVLANETRIGLPGSLNRGIKKARGKYIVRVDGDDFVSVDYLYLMGLFLDHNHYMDAVACDYMLIDDKENPIERRNCLEAPIGCGIMFRIDHLVDIGLYDEEFLMHEDQDLRRRFLNKYQIHRLELPLYRYRRHDDNLTNDNENSRLYSEKMARKHEKAEE